FADGKVSCDVRLADAKGGNAGLILRVSDPKVGADAWVGYEVSFSAGGQHVLLGRHERNYRQLALVPAKIAPGRWHRLEAELAGAEIRVSLDGASEPVIRFKDPNPIPPGLTGVRTWNSDASFRDLVIEPRGGARISDVTFRPEPRDVPVQNTSGM